MIRILNMSADDDSWKALVFATIKYPSLKLIASAAVSYECWNTSQQGAGEEIKLFHFGKTQSGGYELILPYLIFTVYPERWN